MAVAKFQADVERDFAADKFGLKTFPTLVLLPKGSKGGERLGWRALWGGTSWGCRRVLNLQPAQRVGEYDEQRWPDAPPHRPPKPRPPRRPAGDFIKYPSERRDAETLNMWVRTLTGSN